VILAASGHAVVWLDENALPADWKGWPLVAIIRSDLGREQARQFLLDGLADGPRWVDDLKAMVENEPFSWDSVKRARSDMGRDVNSPTIVAVKGGFRDGWYWHLSSDASSDPPKECTNQCAENPHPFDDSAPLRENGCAKECKNTEEVQLSHTEQSAPLRQANADGYRI
jgi:hypothetical protein